jgi:nucleoside-diphosphate-sugar epimerase
VTILVTGAAGLVGTHLLEALRARGERPRALVRAHSRALVESFGAEAVIGDVTDAISWERAAAGVDAIVHGAALVVTPASLDEYTRVNVGGTRLAIEAARRAGARLVHISSVAVYGRTAVYDAGSGGGVTEDYPFQPLPAGDFYARSKRAAELLVQESTRDTSFSATAIRPNVIYGARDRLFTERVLRTIRRGLLPQIGHGRNHLSCVYAGNVAAAILAVLDAPARPGFRAYNVTCDAEPRLVQREFFEAFARASGVHPRFIPVPLWLVRGGIALWSMVLRLARPGRYAGLGNSAVAFILGENPFSIGRITRELGWTPPFDTATAVALSVQNKSPGVTRA